MAQFDDGDSDAISVTEKVEDLAPPSKEISKDEYEALGEAIKSGVEEKVVAAGSKILSKDPNNVRALNGMAVHYINNNKEGLAKILLDRALKVNANEPALHNNLGVIALKEGDLRRAIVNFQKALEVKSDYLTGATNLGSIFLEYKDYSRALGPLSESYRTVKSDLRRGQKAAVEVANNYAVALMGTGEPKKAKSVFEAIVDGDSRSPEPLLNYAILLGEVLNEKREAAKILSKVKFMSDNQRILKKVEVLEQRLEREDSKGSTEAKNGEESED